MTDEEVYVQRPDGIAVYDLLTASEKWYKTDLGTVEHTPTVGDDHVYVYGDELYALSRDDGSIVWSKTVTEVAEYDENSRGAEPKFGSYPTVYGDRVYVTVEYIVGNPGGEVIALDTDGTVQWREDSLYNPYSIAVSDDTVAVHWWMSKGTLSEVGTDTGDAFERSWAELIMDLGHTISLFQGSVFLSSDDKWSAVSKSDGTVLANNHDESTWGYTGNIHSDISSPVFLNDNMYLLFYGDDKDDFYLEAWDLSAREGGQLAFSADLPLPAENGVTEARLSAANGVIYAQFLTDDISTYDNENGWVFTLDPTDGTVQEKWESREFMSRAIPASPGRLTFLESHGTVGEDTSPVRLTVLSGTQSSTDDPLSEEVVQEHYCDAVRTLRTFERDTDVSSSTVADLSEALKSYRDDPGIPNTERRELLDRSKWAMESYLHGRSLIGDPPLDGDITAPEGCSGGAIELPHSEFNVLKTTLELLVAIVLQTKLIEKITDNISAGLGKRIDDRLNDVVTRSHDAIKEVSEPLAEELSGGLVSYTQILYEALVDIANGEDIDDQGEVENTLQGDAADKFDSIVAQFAGDLMETAAFTEIMNNADEKLEEIRTSLSPETVGGLDGGYTGAGLGYQHARDEMVEIATTVHEQLEVIKETLTDLDFFGSILAILDFLNDDEDIQIEDIAGLIEPIYSAHFAYAQRVLARSGFELGVAGVLDIAEYSQSGLDSAIAGTPLPNQ
ncbi:MULTISPECIES: PQQ-binding-like beta-propeller repeat protein [Haloarcula]|uniref:outer membrane protein assembly factor BamB family protein n=1 Tax=Haloarcula TaxID=2237 RepID=UPI0023E8400E|nr:PQQ-binding-like beta-propeller repeat protein [Halomicroarcula sp. SHR3]